MSNPDMHDEWKEDAKAKDAVPLTQDVRLPSTPPGETARPPAQPSSNPNSPLLAEVLNDRDSSTPLAEGRSILRNAKRGCLALVLPPIVLICAVLAAGAVMLYGIGKVLETVGRVLVVGPEMLYQTCVVRGAKTVVLKAIRGRIQTPEDLEYGPLSI
ncbi:hypothetical protein BD414DRAFT_494715 [Trametes punicea]|nr:hypothetical protein BD414DRAFT_494715 [Trametes punicea]